MNFRVDGFDLSSQVCLYLAVNIVRLQEDLHAVVLSVNLGMGLGEGISKGVLLAWSISDEEVELREEFSPSGLPGIQLLGGHKVFKGSMVSVDVETLTQLQSF